MKELEKIYDPSSVEDKHYKKWVDAGYFHAERDPDKRPYTIVMPPPNITGQLHMGHAMDETWQDILIRYKRMQGYAALWVPGTDHASIATEAKIVAKMKEEGLTKQDLGRDRFLERAWDWKKQYGGRIVEQLKKLGCSCDWQRERFTMDEGCSKAVLKVFKKLYDDGLIYRGERIINWCPHCKTSISDAEVEYEEQDGFFWHLKYPVAGGDEFVELATTRPETMLGDTAIAVHPDDERYTHLHGKKVILPLVGKEIPVVCDTYVDREFGTGVVKITPAHDPNDFEVGVRHGLPVVKVLTDDAHHDAGLRKICGHGPLRGAQGHCGRPGSRRISGFHRAAQAQCGHLLPLRHHRGAHGEQAVVREDGASGGPGHRGRARRAYPVRARAFRQALLQLDGEHARLVHQPPALVGPPHPGLLLR